MGDARGALTGFIVGSLYLQIGPVLVQIEIILRGQGFLRFGWMINRELDWVHQVAQLLIGVYENQQQASQEPVWYVHLRAWWRLVPQGRQWFEPSDVLLFAEQAAVINLDRPYRQRVMRLMPQADRVIAQFYQFKSVESVVGGGADPDRLTAIQVNDLIELPHCVLDVTSLAIDRFSAVPRLGDRCQFSYPDGQGRSKTGQVELGFEVGPDYLHSYDKGIDPESGRVLWGAMMGPYRYQKVEM